MNVNPPGFDLTTLTSNAQTVEVAAEALGRSRAQALSKRSFIGHYGGEDLFKLHAERSRACRSDLSPAPSEDE
jgi:hypothetical protein